MEENILQSEQTIYKINRFYLFVILWSLFIQFMPIPPNAYQFLAFLPPIAIYLLGKRKNREQILKLNPLNLKSMIIIIIIWLFTLPLLVFVIEIYNHFFGDTLANIITEDLHTSFLGGLFFIAITPAILEEILMRGIILNGYKNKTRLVAALMNGLLFGMLHLNSFQFAHTFIAGFIASYLVFATNSIFAGILIHFVNNSFPVFMEYFYTPDPNITELPDVNLLNHIIPAAISIFVIYWLIKLLARVNNITFEPETSISRENMFNMPLIISIVLFLSFSALLIFSLSQL